MTATEVEDTLLLIWRVLPWRCRAWVAGFVVVINIAVVLAVGLTVRGLVEILGGAA